MCIESLRKCYQPKKVKILLIGESPPVNGEFFYSDCQMTTFTARAFEMAHGKTFNDNAEFLNYFKSCGCYLDDLSLTPVNTMGDEEREQTLTNSIGSLSQRLHEMKPEIVVSVLRRIEPYVEEAIERSGLRVVFRTLPFAGHGHQNEYIAGLSEILTQYLPNGPESRGYDQDTFLKLRQSYDEAELEVSGRYDKWILTLSGGALALSITFLDKIATNPALYTIWFLAASWVCLVASLCLALWSFLTSQSEIRKMRIKLESIYREGETSRNSSQKTDSKSTNCLNWCSLFSFIIGVILLCVFSLTNIYYKIADGGNDHGEKTTQTNSRKASGGTVGGNDHGEKATQTSSRKASGGKVGGRIRSTTTTTTSTEREAGIRSTKTTTNTTRKEQKQIEEMSRVNKSLKPTVEKPLMARIEEGYVAPQSEQIEEIIIENEPLIPPVEKPPAELIEEGYVPPQPPLPQPQPEEAQE